MSRKLWISILSGVILLILAIDAGSGLIEPGSANQGALRSIVNTERRGVTHQKVIVNTPSLLIALLSLFERQHFS
jgi:hypothetical protein